MRKLISILLVFSLFLTTSGWSEAQFHQTISIHSTTLVFPTTEALSPLLISAQRWWPAVLGGRNRRAEILRETESEVQGPLESTPLSPPPLDSWGNMLHQLLTRPWLPFLIDYLDATGSGITPLDLQEAAEKWVDEMTPQRDQQWFSDLYKTTADAASENGDETIFIASVHHYIAKILQPDVSLGTERYAPLVLGYEAKIIPLKSSTHSEKLLSVELRPEHRSSAIWPAVFAFRGQAVWVLKSVAQMEDAKIPAIRSHAIYLPANRFIHDLIDQLRMGAFPRQNREPSHTMSLPGLQLTVHRLGDTLQLQLGIYGIDVIGRVLSDRIHALQLSTQRDTRIDLQFDIQMLQALSAELNRRVADYRQRRAEEINAERRRLDALVPPHERTTAFWIRSNRLSSLLIVGILWVSPLQLLGQTVSRKLASTTPASLTSKHHSLHSILRNPSNEDQDASTFSLKNILRPDLPDWKARAQISAIITKVDALKLSREKAADLMEIQPSFRSVYIRHGVVLLAAPAAETALLNVSAFLDLTTPGQADQLRFMVAPYPEQIDKASRADRGGTFYPDDNGIEFVAMPDPEIWTHEYGHYFRAEFSMDLRDQLTTHWTAAGESMKQFSDYAFTGHAEDEGIPWAVANQAFAETVRLWWLHSDQLFKNPEIMGKNPHLSFFLEQCARQFVFHSKGKNWLRLYRPSWSGNNTQPEIVDLPILLPEEGAPSLVDQIKAFFTEVGYLNNPDIPLEFAQSRLRESLQSVSNVPREPYERNLQAQTLKLSPASRDIFIRHGIVVLAPSEAETTPIGEYLARLWPGLASQLHYIIVRPKEATTPTSSTFVDLNGRGIVIHGALDETSFLNALGQLVFSNTYGKGNASIEEKFQRAHKTMSVIAPDATDAAQGFTAVVRLLVQKPEKVLWGADKFDDFGFWYFVEEVNRQLDFDNTKNQRVRRIFRPNLFPSKSGPGYIDRIFIGQDGQDYPDFAKYTGWYFEFDPSLKFVSRSNTMAAMLDLADKTGDRHRRGLAYFVNAYNAASQHSGAAGSPYFKTMARYFLSDIADDPDALSSVLNSLHDHDPKAVADATLILKNLPASESDALQQTSLRLMLQKWAALEGHHEPNTEQGRDLIHLKLQEFIGGSYKDTALDLLQILLKGDASTPEAARSNAALRLDLLTLLNDATLLSHMDGHRLGQILTDYRTSVQTSKIHHSQEMDTLIASIQAKLPQKRATTIKNHIGFLPNWPFDGPWNHSPAVRPSERTLKQAA